MHKRYIRTLNLLWVALVLPFQLCLAAETHIVFIEDLVPSGGEFRPNDITIQVGDTVQWWAQSNEHEHTVVADDQSFHHEDQFLRWQWELTFDTPGEYRYHCDKHSIPGRDINVFENGLITVVEADDGETPFQVNSALTDAWFNPLTNGQGFFIIVWEESKLVFLSWFTFDSVRPSDDVPSEFGEAGHRWVTALGPFDQDTATLDVFLSTGGVLDSAEPPVITDQTPIGTITIEWTGCNAGILTYSFPALQLSGSIPIQRIVLDKVPACEAAQP